MKKFILKAFIISIPFIAIFLFYVITDPYKIIYSYKSFFPSHVALNKEYVSYETFKRYNPEEKYDSFIFGNSRSIFYEIKSWEKHISSHKCFHFDAATESLRGVHDKITYLHNHKIPLKNVLIVLDYSLLKKGDLKNGILFLDYPEVSGMSQLEYQFTFFKEFIVPDFALAYFDYRIHDSIKQYMINEQIFNVIEREYTPQTNEGKYTVIENTIKKDPKLFYTAKKMLVFQRKPMIEKYTSSVIKEKQRKLLQEMHSIFKQCNTNYRIVISPLYDQKQLNPKDLDILYSIFGKQNVFDFSGKNWITDNYMNYYESSHYRPFIADSIMNIIYK